MLSFGFPCLLRRPFLISSLFWLAWRKQIHFIGQVSSTHSGVQFWSHQRRVIDSRSPRPTGCCSYSVHHLASHVHQVFQASPSSLVPLGPGPTFGDTCPSPWSRALFSPPHHDHRWRWLLSSSEQQLESKQTVNVSTRLSRPHIKHVNSEWSHQTRVIDSRSSRPRGYCSYSIHHVASPVCVHQLLITCTDGLSLGCYDNNVLVHLDAVFIPEQTRQHDLGSITNGVYLETDQN